MYRSTMDSVLQENLSHHSYSNSHIQTNHVEQSTDVLRLIIQDDEILFNFKFIFCRCAHCFAPKTNDLYTRFCTECGLPWQKLTQISSNNRYSVI